MPSAVMFRRENCSHHRACVLVVEDDDDLREILADALRVEGYRVETASNGAEALAAIERSPPCLMLLDLMMPVMNGWQVVDQLQAGHSEVPFCIMSAAGSNAPTGSVCVLHKPMNLDALLRLVAEHCLTMAQTG